MAQSLQQLCDSSLNRTTKRESSELAKSILVRAVEKIDALYHQPNNSQQPKLYAHTRHDFAKLLGYLRVDRSCLLSGNRVENLLLLNQEL